MVDKQEVGGFSQRPQANVVNCGTRRTVRRKGTLVRGKSDDKGPDSGSAASTVHLARLSKGWQVYPSFPRKID